MGIYYKTEAFYNVLKSIMISSPYIYNTGGVSTYNLHIMTFQESIYGHIQ